MPQPCHMFYTPVSQTTVLVSKDAVWGTFYSTKILKVSVAHLYHHATVIKVTSLYAPGLHLLYLYGSTVSQTLLYFVMHSHKSVHEGRTPALWVQWLYGVCWNIGIMAERIVNRRRHWEEHSCMHISSNSALLRFMASSMAAHTVGPGTKRSLYMFSLFLSAHILTQWKHKKKICRCIGQVLIAFHFPFITLSLAQLIKFLDNFVLTIYNPAPNVCVIMRCFNIFRVRCTRADPPRVCSD